MNKRDELILSHLQLVEIIARKIKKKYPMHIETDDLIQSGMLGLIDAAEKFDKKLGYKFKTYAERRIYGSIIDYMRDENPLGRKHNDDFKNIEYIKELLETSGKDSSVSAIARISNISKEKIHEILKISSAKNAISLEDHDSLAFHEIDSIFNDAAVIPNAIEIIHKQHQSKQLKRAIELLPIIPRKVFKKYYFEMIPMSKIADELHVSESRVHQIISRGLVKLRRIIRVNRIDL